MAYYLSAVTTSNFKGDGRVGKNPKDTLDGARKVAIKKIHNLLYDAWDYKKSTFMYRNKLPLYGLVHIYNDAGNHVGIVVWSNENYHPKTGHLFYIKGAWKKNAEMWGLNKDGSLGEKM